MDSVVSAVVTYLPIIISILAISISFYTVRRNRKSDQFKIAMDLNNRIQGFERRYAQIHTDYKEGRLEGVYNEEYYLVYEVLNAFDLFSFLVNHKEITNASVQTYIISQVRGFFRERKSLSGYTVEHLQKFDELGRLMRARGFTL